MVKFLTYKKKQIPVRLSYRALKALKGQDMNKLSQGGEFDSELFESLLWAGLQSGHTAEEISLELTRTDMEDVLDECFTDFVKMIPEFFPKQEKNKTGNEVPNQQLQNESPMEALPKSIGEA